MARSGRFGRLPRAAPDLSATLVALMREYANQVDQNMVDAWKNGGEVDGEPVTDSRLLGHFKTRRDSLSKDDPLWAEWDNRVTQYDFAIEDSKMRVKWDNGQATPAQMRAFYAKWEKKTPDNTEFDRTLRSAMGQWAQAASAGRGGGGGGGGGRSRKQSEAEAHAKSQEAIYNGKVKAGDALNGALVWLAKELGIIPPGDNASLADTEIRQGDISMLLDIIEDGTVGDPRFQPAVDSVTAYMKGIDPNFTWSGAYMNTKFDAAREGLNQLIGNARTKTEANQWADRKEDMTITNNRVSALDPMADYIAARETWETKMANSGNDPVKQREATYAYLQTISGIYGTLTSGGSPSGDSRTDQALSGPLATEINFLQRGVNGEQLTGDMPPTLFDNSTGTTAVSGTDAQGWGSILNVMNTNYDKIKGGGWVEPYFDATLGEVILKFHGADENPGAGQVAIPSAYAPGGGQAVPMFVTPQQVPIVVIDANGNPVDQQPIRTNAAGQPVDLSGAVIDFGADPDAASKVVPAAPAAFTALTMPGPNGETQTLYQTTLADGRKVYTLTPPIAPDLGELRMVDGQPVFQVTAQPDATGQFAPYFNPDQFNHLKTSPPEATNGMPDVFNTSTGALFAAEFNNLDERAPDYERKRDALNDRIASSGEDMMRMAEDLRARGLGGEAANLERDASLLASDMMKVRFAEVGGDPSKLLNAMGLEGTVGGLVDTGRGIAAMFGFGAGNNDPQGINANADARSRAWMLQKIDEAEARGGGAYNPASRQAEFDRMRGDLDRKNPGAIKLPDWITGGATNPGTVGGLSPDERNSNRINVPGIPGVGAPGSFRPPAAPVRGVGAPGAFRPPTMPPVAPVPPPGGAPGAFRPPPIKPPPVAPAMSDMTKDDVYKPPPLPPMPSPQGIKGGKAGNIAL